jgi:prepilin-type N-terminal cleavage/methylation domain-containing protein
MMPVVVRRRGFSLLELIAAICIATVVAMMGIHHLRPAGDSGKQHSCDLTRQLLQNDVQRYLEMTGNLPRADMIELISPQFAGPQLPVCPATKQSYTMSRDGTVSCPTHESTRRQ